MKKFVLLIMILLSYSVCLFAQMQSENPPPIEKEKSDLPPLFDSTQEKTTSKQGATLEEELKINVEKLNAELKTIEQNYQIYKGLAITGYSFAGLGLALIIIDALAATPSEDPTDIKKFGDLTWSAIPFLVVGTLFSVTFRILESEENDKKLLKESNYYDARSELELIQSQLYGEKPKEGRGSKEDINES